MKKVDLMILHPFNFTFSPVFLPSQWQEHTTEFQCNIASASESGLGNIYLFTVLGKVTSAQVHIYLGIVCIYISIICIEHHTDLFINREIGRCCCAR